MLGLWARDENGWRDVKVEAVKLLLASDVLDWFVLQATFDQALIGGLLVGGKFALWIGEQVCARDL